VSDLVDKSVVGHDLGPCPFCGMGIAFANGEEAGVLHAMPTCDAFEDLGPIEFLVAVRKKREAKAQA
jgi:hypothetical protein